MNSLTAGEATLTTTVSFTDPLGQQQSWTDAVRTVYVNTQAVPPAGTVWVHQTTGLPSTGCGTNASACMAPSTTPLTNVNAGNLTINLNRENQLVTGVGAMLTDSAAVELTSLPTSDLDKVMSNLFSAAGGAGISLLRIPIGPNDFSPSDFSYQSSNGSPFNLYADPDEADILQVLNLAKQINPNLVIIASPWTAPPWMKTNDTSYTAAGGNTLKQNCKEVNKSYCSAYASYLVDFVEAYAAKGIRVSYLTVQNEPGNTAATTSPGMIMTEPEEQGFIDNYLNPELSHAGLSTQVLGFDWNWDDAKAWKLSDLLSSDAVAGTAWHCYDGDASEQSDFAHYSSDLDFITECSGHTNKKDPAGTDVITDDVNNFASNFDWAAKNLIAEGLDNWASGVIVYNLALNDECGPQLPSPGYTAGAPSCMQSPKKSSQCRSCTGLVTVMGGATDKFCSDPVCYNVDYWVLAQASSAFIPGAREVPIKMKKGLSNLYAAAALNPDGTIGLFVSNQASTSQTITVNAGGEGFTFSVNAESVASFGWLE
jgi:glucosylceramidase